MKKLFLLLLVSVCIFCSCHKDYEDLVEFKGVYEPLTNVMMNAYVSSIVVSDNTFQFDRNESQLSSQNPASKQNLFTLTLGQVSDPGRRIVTFRIFVPAYNPEKFFKPRSYTIDSLRMAYAEIIGPGMITKYDDFIKVNGVLNLETASYTENAFIGSGSFKLLKRLDFKNSPDLFFPPQIIEFEFKKITQ
jgi:hypothetical protein